jgi:hypothetical protein
MKRIPGKTVRWIVGSIALLVLPGLALQAHANMQYKDYYPLRDSEDMQVYVWGLGKGMSWANTMLENSGRRMLYCVPVSFVIDAPNLSRVISQEAAFYDDTQLPRVTLEQLLAMGMIRNFPCQGGGGQ